MQGVNTPDIYGYPDHPGTPRPGLLPWFPKTTSGHLHRQGPGRLDASPATASTSLYGGEFTAVNGVRQQGLVRYAVRSIAPNKQGPRPVTAASPRPVDRR